MRLGLAIAALVSLTACGASGNAGTDGAPPAAASSTTTEGDGYFAYMAEKDLKPVDGIAKADVITTAVEICRWMRDGGALDRIGEPGVLDVPEYLTEREIKQIGFGAVRGECPEVNERLVQEGWDEMDSDGWAELDKD